MAITATDHPTPGRRGIISARQGTTGGILAGAVTVDVGTVTINSSRC